MTSYWSVMFLLHAFWHFDSHDSQAVDQHFAGLLGKSGARFEQFRRFCCQNRTFAVETVEAFCQIQKKENDNILTDIKTLYIDDLCVDEACRGQSIGRELYDYVKEYAISEECYNVTLNVWACNESAMRFYEKCGLIPQKYGMEVILK